jgi:predicted transport protein
LIGFTALPTATIVGNYEKSRLDFNEIDDPSGLAEDTTERKFFVHAKYEGGVALKISDVASIASAIPLIRQAHAASRE